MGYKKKKTIIIANWKMNPVSLVEVDSLVKALNKEIKKSNGANIIICPPSIFFSRIKLNQNFNLGVQNFFWEDKGSYTGEISALMAKNSGASYAIIGHSERRIYFNEDDEMINVKIIAAFKNKLKPILCVGETLREKENGKTGEIVAFQIEKALKNIEKTQVSSENFIIAYEPIWSIGTGDTPSCDEMMSVQLLIKKVVSNLYDRETAKKIPILYGGSVDSQNAFDFVDKAGMDGLLIGGASLNASEFARIVNLFQ